jgi:hypothetical protein
MTPGLLSSKHRERALALSFAWAYLVSMVVALVGLFLPFVQQQFGCPPTAACILPVVVAQPSLVHTQVGPTLLGLVSGALLVGLLKVVVAGRTPTLIPLALSAAILAVVSFDAATAGSWVWGHGDPLPVSFEAGFYLATIGSASASLMALLLLGGSFSQPRCARRISGAAA